MPDEARLKAVVEAVVDGVILLDEFGRILLFNPASERLFGYRAEETLGRSVTMLFPVGDHEDLERFFEGRRSEIGDTDGVGFAREMEALCKNGGTIPVHFSIGESRKGGETFFAGVVHDLSQQKEHEKTLLGVASRLEAVVATAVDGVILIDARGTVQMFNPACETLFGYKAEEVIGQNVRMLMPEPFRKEHDGYLENYRRTGERKIIGIGREVEGRRKDGDVFPMDLSVGEAQHGGEAIFIGVIHDLTERKRTQEQLVQAQKMETVGQLSGGIAHDFNNLLTVIIGNADALADKLKARPDLRHLCETIIGAGERGAELTRRLLAFGRRQALQPEVVDCNILVDGMLRLLQRTLREDIHIVTSLQDGLLSAYADPAQLENAILNLALNAQDAMPDGGCLTISTGDAPLDEKYQDGHPEVPPGHYIMLSITDDGEGMPPGVLARVFEPFFTTKDVGKGSGLGLSMVYGFVKQSNGHVAIYSEPGLGTTVRLYLPAAEGQEQRVALPASENAALARGAEAIVLLAEDDPFVRGYAVNCLQSLGYEVLTAETGQEALGLLNDGAKPDVLFTDIVMPGGVSGWQLAEQAQRLHPDLRILYTSGYALETLSARDRLPKAAAVLSKPYRKHELAQRLREVLDGAEE